MLYLPIPMCKFDGCSIKPNYNYNGEKAIYCFKHKLDKMINVNIQKCKYENCFKVPSFNYQDETKCLYCKEHMLEGMINVRHNINKCLYENCNKRPNYNFFGKKERLYCKEHKLDGMININTKKCKYVLCKKSPSYNFINETYPIYCKEHKQDGMINIKKEKCSYPRCQTTPCYNYPNEKTKLFCSVHKLNGMIDIKNKLCQYEDCKLRAIYSLPNKRNCMYCSKHKQDGMIDVNSLTCKSEWCLTTISIKKYDGYCLHCYIHLFPEKPVSRNYKTKEYSVVEFVKSQFKEYNWIADKRIQDGCSKRRPDLMLDLGYNILIIEVDENQHTGYDCSCENKRLMEISQDVNHRPLIFIRFNPDGFINIENKVIQSCWGVNKSGICTIKKTKQTEWNNRLNTLKKQIEYWTKQENISDKTIEVIQLFYDENIQ
jgi:hypothetical protein